MEREKGDRLTRKMRKVGMGWKHGEKKMGNAVAGHFHLCS